MATGAFGDIQKGAVHGIKGNPFYGILESNFSSHGQSTSKDLLFRRIDSCLRRCIPWLEGILPNRHVHRLNSGVVGKGFDTVGTIKLNFIGRVYLLYIVQEGNCYWCLPRQHGILYRLIEYIRLLCEIALRCIENVQALSHCVVGNGRTNSHRKTEDEYGVDLSRHRSLFFHDNSIAGPDAPV